MGRKNIWTKEKLEGLRDYVQCEQELKNYKLIRSIYMSQTQRNEKARKRFFSWWGAELKKFVKDAQDMIKDAEMAERVSKESVFGKDAQDMIRDAEKEVDDQADIERIRERL